MAFDHYDEIDPSANNHPSTPNSSRSSTYEATKASQSTQHHADLIHWDHSKAYRDCPYRQLHHQRGWIGSFKVRLLEACNLQRSYWSALALPAVRHLKLSKAHGAVSAFCNFSLEFEYLNENESSSSGGASSRSSSPSKLRDHYLDRKPAAARDTNIKKSAYSATSPVVPSSNAPVWDNCEFEFPLRKGAMQDGQRILLKVRVEEDATAVESLFPGANARLLGVGTLDLTELCLGETVTGQALPGVRDVWVPISMVGQTEEVERQQALAYAAATSTSASAAAASYSKDDPLAPPPSDAPKPPPCTGMVRVLVSYQPHGLEPQVKDVVALEAFARRSPWHSSCRPLLPPLKPLSVLHRRGPYLLCEYELAGGASSGRSRNSKACVRLHRNAVFVIERQNVMDAAQNLALLPLDVVSTTPLGQATGQLLGPVLAASRELAMPAMLSARLAWVAARTTGMAGMSGVLAVSNTLWNVGTSSLISSHRGNGTPRRHDSDDENRQRQRDAATAKFVSL